ncbi:MAG TPA: hypothetical protein VLA93_15435 [Pyrinomonadaceae bacterium]|nr:hypothetical protein [Pyrinomonadaceae bacterium]
MRLLMKARPLVALLLLITLSGVCRAEITLALNKTFVQRYKDRATMTTNLNVDHYPDDAKPHGIARSGEDGDIHMAGRDSVFKLPLVAEIMNARFAPTAIQRLLDTIPEQAISVTGAWRVWFEHPGNTNHIQGNTFPVSTDSNPDHVAEIHPITKFSGIDVLSTFAEIKSTATPPKIYEAYPAETAFPYYEGLECTIKASNTAIMIASKKSIYNYADFYIELAGAPKEVSDGHLVLANVYESTSDEDEAVNAAPRRMVFVKGTEPANRLLSLPQGGRLHVLGIPRINLAEVYVIAQQNGATEVSVNLPYEMIIAAILP